jgi:hypothetical protein
MIRIALALRKLAREHPELVQKWVPLRAQPKIKLSGFSGL